MTNQRPVPLTRRQFGSDNYAGICPEAMQAIADANTGHAPAYGNDVYTWDACEAVRTVFETDCDVYFVFNGTAANALALATLCQSYHAVLAHGDSHAIQDECSAPEFFSGGAKLLLVPGRHGKLDLGAIEQMARKRTDLHFPKIRAISFAQATEAGTVYSLDEVQSIGGLAQRLGLRVHMDGARFANAVAELNVSPADLTWRAGVDILSFGLTKNGLPVGEAVVIFNRELGKDFEFRCKQAGQLASKMRFITAPWTAMLRDGAWLRHAGRANACAKHLEEALRKRGMEISFPRQANSVYVQMSGTLAQQLRAKGWRFHDYPDAGGYRLMCSWDTQTSDVEAFLQDLG